MMPQLQRLLSVQLAFLSAEPEGQKSVTAPGDREAETAKRNISLYLLLLSLSFSLRVSVPGVAEKSVILPLLSPNQPLSEGGVV